MARRYAWLVAFVVLLAGCWREEGFDPGHRAFDPLEKTLTSGTVAGRRSLSPAPSVRRPTGRSADRVSSSSRTSAASGRRAQTIRRLICGFSSSAP